MDIRLIGLGGWIGGALAFSTVADSAVLRVPQQYTTIQAAVDAAQEGDTVRVAAGIYAERVVISGKALSLVGAGAGQTTIDATRAGRPLTVSTTGSGQVSVSGFTLKNGQITWDDPNTTIGSGEGGGVYAEYANIALRNNVITNNLGCLGTSVSTIEVTMTMVRNRIENNPGNHDCGQQSVIIRGDRGAESVISRNVIQQHNVTGLILQDAGKITVSHNIFRDNVADWVNMGLEQGGLVSVNTQVTLTNNLFEGNSGVAVGAASFAQSETGTRVRITDNSFVNNSSAADPVGTGPSSLALLGVENTMIVENNQFDEVAGRPVIFCNVSVPIDASNVFASDRDGALTGPCVSAE